jgi:LysM repeat protein
MKHKIHKFWGIKAIRLLIVAALLAALLPFAVQPQSAQAATCGVYHIVKAGDTTVKIAQSYDIKWKEIARANSLKAPYRLTVGQQLCIPIEAPVNVAAENAADIKMTASVVGNTIQVSVRGLSARQAYNVKVRDADLSIGGWHKVGVLKAKRTDTFSGTYILPRDLRSTIYLQVCLKNATNDDLACRTVVHIY